MHVVKKKKEVIVKKNIIRRDDGNTTHSFIRAHFFPYIKIKVKKEKNKMR